MAGIFFVAKITLAKRQICSGLFMKGLKGLRSIGEEKNYKQLEGAYAKKIEQEPHNVQGAVSHFLVVILNISQTMKYQLGGMVLNGINLNSKKIE